MNNYDTMSVEELRNQYDILWLEEMVLKKLGTIEQLQSLRTDKELVFAALRKAAIREASVGVGTVRREGKAPLLGAPEMDISCETKDGDYDLIPKERP